MSGVAPSTSTMGSRRRAAAMASLPSCEPSLEPALRLEGAPIDNFGRSKLISHDVFLLARVSPRPLAREQSKNDRGNGKCSRMGGKGCVRAAEVGQGNKSSGKKGMA